MYKYFILFSIYVLKDISQFKLLKKIREEVKNIYFAIILFTQNF